MKQHVIGLFIILFVCVSLQGQDNNTIKNYTFSGPFIHKNLAVFLIHGRDIVNGKKFMTLQEAMGKELVVVHETGNVNQLEISNKSDQYDIFIKSGEIVKGGKQDRTIQYNSIIPPNAKNMKISSFCVEQGRWRKRGNEKLNSFSSSQNMVVSNEMKISIQKDGSQGKVWDNVSKVQNKLGIKLKGTVRGSSGSSLQLTLEHQRLKKAEKEYLQKIENINAGKKQVIGYAFVINGKIKNIEIFASQHLFIKLWPKLVRSGVVEAIADNSNKTHKRLRAADIKRFMLVSENGKNISKRRVSKRVGVTGKESADNYLFETVDRASGTWINKTYLSK